jgi:hypothetical protein
LCTGAGVAKEIGEDIDGQNKMKIKRLGTCRIKDRKKGGNNVKTTVYVVH